MHQAIKDLSALFKHAVSFLSLSTSQKALLSDVPK